MERAGVASNIPAAGIAEANAESMVWIGRSSLCQNESSDVKSLQMIAGASDEFVGPVKCFISREVERLLVLSPSKCHGDRADCALSLRLDGLCAWHFTIHSPERIAC